MFTGLIQAIGHVDFIGKTSVGLRLSIQAPFAESLQLGESVAVNGVCLTVNDVWEGAFAADVMPETVDVTTLSQLKEKDPVNLERALKVGDHLGGHYVQGHVDGVATVADFSIDELGARLNIEPPSSLMKYIAHKGSVTLNGVSLTVSGITKTTCEVSLVPHTLQETTLRSLNKGDVVNVEVDLLARYIEQLNV
jgi:riboflavin synthase